MGRPIYDSAYAGSQGGSGSNYTFDPGIQYFFKTNNGLLVYLGGGFEDGGSGNYYSAGYHIAGYVDLNDLAVNQASSPVPTGRLWVSKEIGKNGEVVTLSWKLD